MSIFITPYDTRACHGFVMDRTIKALEEALVSGYGLFAIEQDRHVQLLQGGDPRSDAVPAFTHPIILNSGKFSDTPTVVVDVRYCGKWDPLTASFRVRNNSEYDLAVMRARLSRVWVSELPSVIQNLSPLPMTIYASWVSEGLARRFALEPREQMLLTIMAAYFYACLFTDEKEFDDQTRLKVGGTIARATRVSAKDVLEVIEQLPVINGIQQFCELTQEVTQSVRLKELNPGLVFAILGGSWFGTNAREMMTVAIEHPPTWIAILMSAFTNRSSYRNTPITKIAERNSGKGANDTFIRAVVGMLEAVNS